jgi:Putative rhamnosyl transferase
MQPPGPIIRRRRGEVAPQESRGLLAAAASSSASSFSCLCAGSTRGFLFLLMALAGWTLHNSVSSYSATTRLVIAHQDQAHLHDVMPGGGILHYYTPMLYYSSAAAGSNDDHTKNQEKYKKEDFPWPMIHIVITPFMQKQPNLTALGHARIKLFEAFCLPTMQQQTSQQFLWIIKTDPDLDQSILKKMVQLLQPFPNAYLVGSNGNYLHWRNGGQGRDLADHRVYTGNRTLLKAAMALEMQLPVLETRLDADDGMHVQYIETLQKVALEQVFLPLMPLPVQEKQEQRSPTQSRLKWKHWCADRNVDWHSSIIAPTARNNSSNNNNNMSSSSTRLYGKIVGPVHDQWCITPGLTTAYAVGTTLEQAKSTKHHLLRKMFKSTPLSPEQSCGLPDSSQCVDDLKDLYPFEVIRARTPTSAGMKDILGGTGWVTEEDNTVLVDEAMWDNLHTYFRIQREKVQFAQEYFTQNMVEIAKENLVGQCVGGFTCKGTSKAQLQKIIAAHSG